MEDVQGVPSTPSETVPLDAADQAVVNGDQSAFREIRLAQRTGKPVPQVLPTPAASAPAPPVEQAAPTDAPPKPASEPGSKPKKNADSRVQELLADRDRERSETARLRAELETLRRQLQPDVKPAESSPAKPTTREYERFKAMPGYPQVTDFDDYADYTAEVTAFIENARYQERSKQQQQDYDAGQFRSAQTTFDAKGAAAYPDFRDVLNAAGQAGRKWPEHITRKVLTHEQGHAIAYGLAKAKDDEALYQRIADPVAFGEYVAEVLHAQEKPPAPSPVPTITTAPEPPFTLGSRPHDAGDEIESAVAAGDMTAFKAAKLRQRMAMHR